LPYSRIPLLVSVLSHICSTVQYSTVAFCTKHVYARS